MSYYSYVIYSSLQGKKYYGHTEDLKLRVQQHNEGSLGKYTRNKGPWILIFHEEFATRGEVMKRESYYKTGAGRDFIKRQTGY
jgi:putative endonuclease